MFLGLDIGTSAVKGLLWDGEAVVGTATAPLTTQIPVPGASEQHPEAWWQGIQAVCAQMRDLPGWDAIAALGLSGQMHGAVCLDRDGALLRPAILWNDNRAVADSAAMALALPDVEVTGGVPPMPGFTAPKLAWLARAEPEVHARVSMVLQTKDWVGFRLHGELVSDPSDASGTLWLDQATRDWDEAALAFSGLDSSRVPQLADGTEIAGHVRGDAAQQLSLPPGVPVVRGGGDAMAGAAGIGVVGPGQALISLGTSGQYLVANDRHLPNPARLVHSFAHCLPETYIQMAAMLNGAAPMAWLSGVLGQPVSALLMAAEAADPAETPLFLPYLTGERTPHGDAAARAGFEGLSHGSGPGEMMRAVVDAIAYSFADAQAALRGAGCTPGAPLAIGGGARSDLVLQTLADVLGTPISRPKDAEHGPALGAAKLAAVGVGALEIADLAIPPKTAAQFTPDPKAQAAHAPRLARYRDLYAALTGVCARP